MRRIALISFLSAGFDPPPKSNRIRKRQANFLGYVMREEKLEHLETTGMMEGKCSRGKQRGKTDRPTKWLKVRRVTKALKATSYRDAWKAMIAYSKELGT